MLLVIIRKELKRVFSDKRLVFSAFILPAVSIFVLYSLMGNMIGSMNDVVTEHKSILHVFNAPVTFETYMKEQSKGVELHYKINGLEQTKEQIKLGEVDVAIVFPDDFDLTIINYENQRFPNVNTYFNPSEEFSQVAINRIEFDLLAGYQSYLLAERFGGISNLTAFTMNIGNDSKKIAVEGKEAGLGMSFMLPMLLNVMLFAGAMGIGIDVIAGEKERGTMATLLLTPVKRETIAFGKVISLGIVATISAASSFGAIIASLPFASVFLAAGSDVSLNSFKFGVIDYMYALGYFGIASWYFCRTYLLSFDICQ
jgi:sodium transport system permease protein